MGRCRRLCRTLLQSIVWLPSWLDPEEMLVKFCGLLCGCAPGRGSEIGSCRMEAARASSVPRSDIRMGDGRARS